VLWVVLASRIRSGSWNGNDNAREFPLRRKTQYVSRISPPKKTTGNPSQRQAAFDPRIWAVHCGREARHRQIVPILLAMHIGMKSRGIRRERIPDNQAWRLKSG
jgi:hypothetical protein